MDKLDTTLWVIRYSVNGISGCAICAADSSKKAEIILKTEGSFNASPENYQILSIQDIAYPATSGLIVDAYNI